MATKTIRFLFKKTTAYEACLITCEVSIFISATRFIAQMVDSQVHD